MVLPGNSPEEEIVQFVDIDEHEIVPLPRNQPPRQPLHPLNTDLEDDELSQPFVEIHQLFTKYNHKHFNGRIKKTYVEFSSRMTLCAGTCTFKGVLGGCRIGLSEPLLKFRPRSDLLSTLLHEMIHAFLFETEGVAVRDGVDGHGPRFMSHANRINNSESGKINITPYHTFTDEVDLYRVHHWTCNLCGKLIKRAMNRAPAPRDPFWPMHEKTCGGAFVKTKEPEKKKKVKKKPPKNRAVAVDPLSKGQTQLATGVIRTMRIDSMLKGKSTKNPVSEMVACPSCNTQVSKANLNTHLDVCLAPGMFSEDSGEVICIPPSDEEPEPGPSDCNTGKQNRQTYSSDEIEVVPVVQQPTKTSSRKAVESFRKPPLKRGRTESEPLRNAGKQVEQTYPSVEVEVVPIFQQPTKPSALESFSKPSLSAGRTESDALRNIVPNCELLMTFALDPYSVNRESLESLIRPASRDKPKVESSNRSVDIASILKDEARDIDTPLEMQKRAKVHMQRLCAGGDGDPIVVSDGESEGMTKAGAERVAKVVNSKAKSKKNGHYLSARDVLELVGVNPGTSTSPGSPQVEFKEVNKDDRTPLRGSPLRISKTVGQKGMDAQIGMNKKGNRADEFIRSFDGETGKRRVQRDSTDVCPVCDAVVRSVDLDNHVNDCLTLISGAESKRQKKSPRVPVPTEQPVENCPVCDATVRSADFDSHVNDCLTLISGAESKRQKKTPRVPVPAKQLLQNCPVCDAKVESADFDSHVYDCLTLISGAESKRQKKTPGVPVPAKQLLQNCPVCDAKVESADFDSHKYGCLTLISGAESKRQKKTPGVPVPAKQLLQNCPVCDAKVESADFDSHVYGCLTLISGAEAKRQKKSPRVPVHTKQPLGNCPVCDHAVQRNELEEHVNRCLNDSDVAPLLFSADQDVRGSVSREPQHIREKKKPREKHEKADSDLPHCPVCDNAISREILKAHVSQCMLSAGLGDAF